MEEHVARPCGCAAGGVAASVALFAYVAYLFFAEGAPPHWELGDLGWGAAAVFGAAVAGKAAGIVRARRALDGV